MSQTDSLPRQRAKAGRYSLSGTLERVLPRLVVAPSLAVALFFVYGYMLWTFILSLTSSGMLPQYHFVGFEQYARLFANERWNVAATNLVVFGGLFIVICLILGLGWRSCSISASARRARCAPSISIRWRCR